jgi:hypothetical protein
VPATKGKKSQLPRRRKAPIFDWLVPVFLLLLIVGVAALFSYLIVEPLVHPNLHPRLIRFGTYLVHFHPRLCRYFPGALLAGVITLHLTALFALAHRQYQMRKRGPLVLSDLKSNQYLNQTMTQTIALLPPEAWQVVKLAFPGLLISVPGMRCPHWEVLEIDELRREMRLALRYVHDPLGIKVWRLYPRRISCSVRLRAKGVRTNVELTYNADSAMDYQTVYQIIDQTKASINMAMEAEKAVL